MNQLEINEKIASFKASLDVLIENYDKYMYSRRLLSELYGVIANALNHIGIENINLIYSIFCKYFLEYVNDISLDNFNKFLRECNVQDLSKENQIIYINKSANISTFDNYEYFFFNEENTYKDGIADEHYKDKFNELTDEQWASIAELFNEENLRGSIFKKTKHGYRNIINGIFWIIMNNRKWRDMPKIFPSFPTCNKYYNSWKKIGFLQIIINKLSNSMDKDDLAILYKNICSS